MKLTENMELNNWLISLKLVVFHLEISGKVSKESHSSNIPLSSERFSVFHLEISGKEFNEEHSENK